MTTKVSNTFVNSYSAQFASGKASFDGMSAFFLRSLIYLKNELAAGQLPVKPRLYEYIAIDKKILETAIEAQEHYLSSTFLGRIKKTFQSFLGLFGVKSSLEITKHMLKNIENEIKSFGLQLPPEAEIQSKSEALMARSIAVRENNKLYTLCYKDPSDYPTLLIAMPDGDVYEVLMKSKSKGGSRYYYEGILHEMETGKFKSVGVISNINPQLRDSSDEIFINRLKQVDNEMRKEFLDLQKLKKIKRVIRAYDNCSIPFGKLGEVNAGFTFMKHHEYGSLAEFMKSDDAKRMTPNDKIDFMLSLLNTFKQLHEKGLIHRDVKTQNIVVRKNKHGKFVPTVIDMVTCISKNNNKKKQKLASTVPWWPPEYVAASLNVEKINGKLIPKPDGIAAATTQAMDTWDLGLVFFQLLYGEDLIGETFKFNNRSGGEVLLYKILHQELPQFLNEMKPDNLVRKEWAHIKKSTQKDPYLWNEIILPMLSADPKQRPSMGDLYTKLQGCQTPLVIE